MGERERVCRVGNNAVDRQLLGLDAYRYMLTVLSSLS